MLISDEQLNRFIELYRKEYGIILPRNEAYDQATALIRIVEILYSGD